MKIEVETESYIAQPIQRCRACMHKRLETVIDLGTMALTGVFPRPGMEVPVAPLRLVQCQRCGLSQLADSVDRRLMYGEHYGYRSDLNASMIQHLGQLAVFGIHQARLHNDAVVLDIGSNDGTFLKQFDGLNMRRIGFDPSAKAEDYPRDIQLIQDFFTAEAMDDVKADLVTSIAMFYDIEDPLSFMRDVASVLSDTGIWIIEQAYMPRLVELGAYDTICHEHYTYYGLQQMQQLATQAGLQIMGVEFNEVNGGSFITVLRKARSFLTLPSRVQKALDKEELLVDREFRTFASRVERSREELVVELAEWKRDDKVVAGYGASTKGNVLLQYCHIDLPYIADVNPSKFGCVTPGSNIDIISDVEARRLAPDAYLVLPWHFRENIIRREPKGSALIFPLPRLEKVLC